MGKERVKKILEVSIKLHGKKKFHGKKAREKEVLVDTTVQEKNITFPTDTKLHKRIAERCVKIAKEAGIKLRQTYKRTITKLMKAQRFRNHPKNYKKAKRCARKLKTIAARLVRELIRKLPVNHYKRYVGEIKIFKEVLSQKRHSKDKIYSLCEPHVYCIAKGKEHKKYEFGTKASIAVTKNSGIIVGAVSHERNKYDAHTLPEVLGQIKEFTGIEPAVAIWL